MTREIVLAALTLITSTGLAGVISALSRRSVDRAAAKKTDAETFSLVKDDLYEEIRRLKVDVRELRVEAEYAAADAARVRAWAGPMQAWADRAVAEIRRLGGHIDPPPPLPERPPAVRTTNQG